MKHRKLRFIFFLLFLRLLVLLGAQTTAQTTTEENNGEDSASGEFRDDEVVEGQWLVIVSSANKSQQMETIERETIEKTHAPDIPSLLEENLGLVVTRYGPYGNAADVSLRGFSIRRIAILVDGVPVNSAASGEFDFYSIDPNSIERIEVIYGGSDTKFNVSGAMGGLINIVTIKKQNPGFGFGGSVSNTSYPQWQDLLDTQNVNIFGSYGSGDISLRANVFANRANNHFLYEDYYGDTRRREGNGVFDAGASVSFIRELKDFSKFIAGGAFYYGDRNIPVSGYSTDSAKQRDVSTRENFMLDMPRAFHDDFSMELGLSHNWKNIDFNSGLSSSLHNEHDIDLVNRWGWYPTYAFSLLFGGDYRFIYLDSTDTQIQNGHRGGLYISSEIKPVKNFLLFASIKGVVNVMNGSGGFEIIPIPKFGFSWIVNDNITIKNNYFRTFKFPDFNDLFWSQGAFTGNPDLKNEDGLGADLSLIFTLKDFLIIDSTLYGQWIIDSIHWTNSAGTWKPENSGKAVFAGWDNKLKLTLPFNPGFFNKPILGFSWVFQLSRLLSGELSYNDSKRIPYMPMHVIGASLELPWEKGSFLVSGHFESSRYAETQNIIKLDPYFLLNVIYNQKLNDYIGVFGKINNLLNYSYVSFADYPMPGISFTLGMNAVFSP